MSNRTRAALLAAAVMMVVAGLWWYENDMSDQPMVLYLATGSSNSIGSDENVVATVLAQGTRPERSACTPDARRLCRGATDLVSVAACLVANRARLSTACLLVLQDHGL